MRSEELVVKKLLDLFKKITNGNLELFCNKYSRRLHYLGFSLLFIALIWGLYFSPNDYQQGSVFKIIYLHVPTAALSLSVYVFMAIAYGLFFIFRLQVLAFFARSCAIYGAVMTALALITGAIWGKPTWGTYWTWDARLTAELILFFLYLAIIALRMSLNNQNQADKITAILAIVGLINIPIIHYSVVWWNSLHQGATIFKMAKPSIAPEMLYPLLISLLAFYLIFFAFSLKFIENLSLEKKLFRKLAISNEQ